MIYYIADTHFGHANIIKYCGRPYSSVEEMNAELIANWNRKVHSEDTVYIVGDFAYRSMNSVRQIALSLNGHKRLITGNHDHSWLNDAGAANCFDDISHMDIINDSGNRIILCHYPLMTWSGERKGAYMVYGHIHNHTNDKFWPLIALNDHMLNAGADLNNYAPVTLRELISNNRSFKANLTQNEV
jgi:calcineurin-like phosphoesterase family protein